MAIRTITDLPDISIDKIELSSNLSKSRMEISLLSNDENSIYVSRSVSCGVLTEAIAADIVKRKLVSVDNIDINGHLTLKDGISAYGDSYFNADKRYLDHEAKLNFNDVNVNSNTFKVNSNDVIGLSCGNASVKLYDDGNNGIVDIKQYGKVEHTKDENDYIVNVQFLKQKLNELSVGILNDINSGAAHIKVDIDYRLKDKKKKERM